MNVSRIFVYGAGGHGKVIADILLSNDDGHFVGFIDDHKDLKGRTVLDFPVFGDGEWLLDEARIACVAVALGVGENRARQLVAERCLAAGIELVSAIHPRAVISRAANLGAGTAVMAGAVVNPCARVGVGVIVNTGAVVDHDTVIGDFAHVSSNATMGGASQLGPLSQLGLGAVVLPGIRVGARSIVGAGGVVVRDLPNDVVGIGVPARIHRTVGSQVAARR
jgi:sugar O-acyltransferase (sialic acid O-acetyltransferase NeuD family)